MTDDDRDIVQQGYLPGFTRGLGGFTAFAAGFSYLSILTGIPQNFYLGYREAGLASFWTWPVVFVGQFLVALCFAELVNKFPFCGGVYAWSKRSGSPFYGWLTGWIYLASLVITIAAVALAMNVVLPSIWSGFQLLSKPSANAVVLGAILIVVSTLINIIGNRWLALIMDVGVVIELLAALCLIILLASQSIRGPEIIWSYQQIPDDTIVLVGALFSASIMSAYVMYGFDTAGTLAEETVAPRQRAPRAILQALAAAFLLGLLLLVAAGCSAPDLSDPQLSSDTGGLPYLIVTVLGGTVGTVFLIACTIAIFICTLAVHANAARVMFAMARDGALPKAKWFGVIDPDVHVPQHSALAVGLLGIMLLLINIDFDRVVTALVCVSIVWANLSYLMTNGRSLLSRSCNDWLGRWGYPIHLIACVWSLSAIVNVSWPRERFYGSEWYLLYSAPLSTALLILLGIVVYRNLPATSPSGVPR